MSRFKELLVALAVVSVCIMATGSGVPDVGMGDNLRVGMSSDLVGGASATVEWDTLTYVFTMDAAMDHYSAVYDTAVANADAVIELTDQPSFAYAMLDFDEVNRRVDALTTSAATYISMGDTIGTKWGKGGAPTNGTRDILVHFPFEYYIPANSQIVSATMNVVASGSWAMSYTDSVSATLMTTADSLWYTSKGVTAQEPDWLNCAHATVSHQISGLNAVGYPASDTAWETDPTSKMWFWQWGDHSDLTGNNASQILDAGHKAIRITNCVQGAVNGAVNNGIIFRYYDRATTLVRFYGFDLTSNATINSARPWFTVKFLTKKYVKPFGSADYAFVFSTDDANEFNVELSDTFAARGVRYTIFAIASTTDSSSTVGYAGTDFGYEELLAQHAKGMDIGSHSRWHKPNFGLIYWQADGQEIVDYVRGMDPAGLDSNTTSTQADYLYADADPAWLYDGAAEYGHADSLRSDLYWGKTFALPINKYNAEAIQALVYHDYDAIRTQAVTGNSILDGNGNYRHIDVAEDRPARADTFAIGWEEAYPRQPRNMRGVPPTYEASRIFGDKASQPSDAQLEFNIIHAAELSRASGNRVICVFAHDRKTNPSGASYADGVDPDEMGVVLDAVMLRNGRGKTLGRVMCVGDYARWMAGSSTAVGTPDGWVASPDTFAYTASDEVWYKPDGLDSRPVRGLK